jgi:hypothetical protein
VDVGRPLADWRSPAPYAALKACGRHAFAWEWLRRSPDYAEAVAGVDRESAGASRFGLHRFEPVDLGASDARPVWRADADPFVLTACAVPASGGDVFDFAALGPLGRCIIGAGGIEHWLWSDGMRNLRVDIVHGSLSHGPVRLDCRIAGFAAAPPQIATLERLLGLVRTRRLVPALFAPERRAARWAVVLRTHDALAAGATQREIAEHLFGMGAMPRWRIAAASAREQVRRLVKAARVAAGVAPHSWLDGRFR